MTNKTVLCGKLYLQNGGGFADARIKKVIVTDNDYRLFGDLHLTCDDIDCY